MAAGETFFGMLRRLTRDTRGNTMVMVAAATIPLCGLIGGGVDMSRAYMVKERLQQACDAAALAGRRSMTTAAMTSTDIAEARRFFDFNFRQGSMGTATFTPTAGNRRSSKAPSGSARTPRPRRRSPAIVAVPLDSDGARSRHVLPSPNGGTSAKADSTANQVDA